MARAEKKLTARQAATAKRGRYGDGGGLWLVVSETGSAKWVYRYTWQGKVTEMGLGSRSEVSLSQAREERDRQRPLLRSGVNPITARREAKVPREKRATFGDLANALFAAKSAEWRSDRHRQQWRETLTKYVTPLWDRPVDEIDTEAVLEVLKPVWATTPETASRVRGRIEAVLDAAKAQGHRSGENPAAWRGHLAHLLPRRQKLSRGHYAAMPYADIPAFVGRLREQDTISALALEFCILTATRSGEIFGARWSEIDMAAKVWIIPAARTKAGREHRVPLSPPALAVIEKLAEARTGDLIFPGRRPGRPLSSSAMVRALRRMGVDATPHGFRSTLRDWAGNETHFPREVAEAALAHAVGNEVEQAYRRSDALEKRRALMDAWAKFIESANGDNIVHFRKSGVEDA